MDPRIALIDQAKSSDSMWDVIVVGGGASGLSVAWDAVSRGLRVALIEAEDFCKGTSSRSTKLVHGGVRYLQKFELGLVREALTERHLLLENAAEFCRPLRFTLPTTAWLGKYYYRLGLGLYDLMASSGRLESSRLLSATQVAERLPTLQLDGVNGGVSYSDAQFDDTGLAIGLVQALSNSGGLALNYIRVERLLMRFNQVAGVAVVDQESGDSWEMRSRVVINATGIFSDEFRNQNGVECEWSVQQSRGSHIVCSRKVLPSQNALIIPKTKDGRVLFAIPWMGHTVIGTTDVAVDKPEIDPQPTEEEMRFLLDEAGRALGVKYDDVLSRWAGLRPLVSKKRSKVGRSNTKSLSRKHIVEVSGSGLISILGGKWTTARAMAEDTMDAAIKVHGLKPKASDTSHRRLVEFGALAPLTNMDALPDITPDSVQRAVRFYYARTAEDMLARRFRTLFLDPEKAQRQSETVLETMAGALSWSPKQLAEQRKSLDVAIKRAQGISGATIE